MTLPALIRWALAHPKLAYRAALAGVHAAAKRDAEATKRARQVIDEVCREVRGERLRDAMVRDARAAQMRGDFSQRGQR